MGQSADPPPRADVVELRVHGVSGTPPDELLERTPLVRVAGDGTAGFFRPAVGELRTDDPPARADDPPGRTDGPPARTDDPPDRADAPPGRTDGPPPGGHTLLEGYSWGGLTSGAAARAFWLLLLPMTLVNAAPRLRPPGYRPRWSPLFWWLARVLGLALTALFVLTGAGLAADLLAWQCRTVDCVGMPGWFATWSTGQRLALALVVPLLMLTFLTRLSVSTATRYEATDVREERGFCPSTPGDAGEAPLTHPDFWRGAHLVARLRGIHTLGGTAAAVHTVVLPAVRWDATPVGWTLLVLAWASAAAAVGVLAVPAVVRRGPSTGWVRVVERAHWGALALAAATVAYLAVPGRPGWRPSGGLPFHEQTVTVVLAVQAVLVVALGAVTGVLWRVPRDRRDEPRRVFHGAGPVVVAGIGVLLAVAFSAGLYLFTAAYLHSGSLRPGRGVVAGAVAAFAVPRPYTVTALWFTGAVLWVVAVAVALGLFVLLGARSPHRWRQGVVLFRAEYRDARVTDPRSRSILRAWWLARLVDHVDQAVLALLALPALAALVAVAAVLAGWPDAWQRIGFVRSATGLGTYGIVLLIVLAYLVGAAAFRATATRRSVGILWDLGAFWPRAVHPLAAPCYAERTVPDLVNRVTWYVREGDRPDGEAAALGTAGRYPGGRVVLAGHSQGSVIAAAAVLQLRPHVRAGVALLTYGSVLRRLYSRYFPAYVPVTLLGDLAAELGGHRGWRNLWRTSDYLGGPVERGPLRLAPEPPDREPPDPAPARRGPADPHDDGPLAGVDVHLTDPRYHRWPGDLVWPAVRRHSGYPADPRFREEVAALGAALPRYSAGEPGPTERQGRDCSSAT
jgi:hypothetical protein